MEEISFEQILVDGDLAWLLLLDGSDPWNQKKEWFPKSKCEIDEANYTIQVPEWLALEKGLI